MTNRNYEIIMNTKEIVRRLHEVASNVSDRLIHTALRSVSLVHYTFRNDKEESFHKAERTGAGTSLVSSLVRNLLFMKIADDFYIIPKIVKTGTI